MIEYHYKENGVFAFDTDHNQEVGYMTFVSNEKNVVAINHTFVHPDYRGQKIADQLFELMIKKVVEENKRVIPICSYVMKKFERDPKLAFLLKN